MVVALAGGLVMVVAAAMAMAALNVSNDSLAFHLVHGVVMLLSLHF